LLGGRVPAGPVNDVADIAADQHVQARDMLPEIDVPDLGHRAALAGVPVHFTLTPGAVRQPGPGLGQHTREVLEQFGITRVHGLGEDSA
ncbi:MAG: CoA transferase, partial [Gammaproteobacteria bacterium]